MAVSRSDYISFLFLKSRLKKAPFLGQALVFIWWRLKRLVYPILYLLDYYPLKQTSKFSDYSPVEANRLIDEINLERKNSTPHGESCLASELDFYELNFKSIFKDLIEPPGKMERKSWEFVKVIQGLQKYGVLNKDSKGLGVGSGCEKPLYFFAKYCKAIVGIDLYASDHPDWVHTANSDILKNPSKYAPFRYPKERLQLIHMDASRMTFENSTFDFVFSFSAIEHFGSRENIKNTMKEIHRILKPQGIAAITTELIITRNSQHHEYFTLDELKESMLSIPGLDLVGNLNLTVAPRDLEHAIDLHKNVATDVSIIFKLGDMAFTPVLLFLRKTS